MPGISDTRSGGTSSSTTQTRGSSTPTNPLWVTGSQMLYNGDIQEYLQQDPSTLTASQNFNQLGAWGQAQNLGNWRNGMVDATGMVRDIATNGTANTYTAQNPGNPMMSSGAALGPAQGYSAAQAQSAQLGPAQGYAAAQTGPAAQGQAQQYQAAQAGQVQLGQALQGAAQQAQAAGLADPRMAAATTLDPAAQSQAGLTADFMNRYKNPFEQAVVNTTLSGMDENAGRVRADQAAAAARNGAFSGSRYGFQEAETERGLARDRAAKEAELRYQGFNTAAALGTGDADRTTNVGMQNARNLNERNLAQGQLGQQRELFNTGQWNNADIVRSGYQQQANLFNTGEANNMAQFNTGQGNQFQLTQGQMDAARGQFNAGQTNQALGQNAQLGTQASIFNAGEQNTNSRFNAGARNDANSFLAGARNTNNLAQGQMNQQANIWNAGATNDASQFGASAANQFGLAQGQMDQQNNQFNATTQNDAVRDYMGRLDTAGRFNATQGDTALARQLQAAGMMGDMTMAGANAQRADMGLQADLGAQQYAAEQAALDARRNQLLAGGQMYGMNNFGLFNGQNTTSSSTTNGSTTSFDSPSYWNQMLAGIQFAGAMSDRALKTDIVRVGEAEGLGLYRYRYLWDAHDRQRVGVMADEVEMLRPDALGPTIEGYRSVDYGKLGLAHLVEA